MLRFCAILRKIFTLIIQILSIFFRIYNLESSRISKGYNDALTANNFRETRAICSTRFSVKQN